MTEPSEISAEAAQSPEDLRAFVGQQVHVFRDNAQEGTGELIEVIPGDFGQWTPEGVVTVHVEDKTLHWEDVTQGTQVASRRQSNAWRLVPVE